MKPREPRVAFIDIETAPIRMMAWTLYETDAVWVEQDTYLLSFAVKWSDKKSIKTFALPDYSNFKKNKADDSELAKDLWRIIDEADLVVAHNGDAFDLKKANSRFAVHGLTPPSPYKSIDTLKIARKYFKFDSNKLDNLGRYLNVGRKIPHTGAHLWRGCVEGDAKSWRLMRRYNAQDVALLERVYLKLAPWHATHPDKNMWTGAGGCPVCQSFKVRHGGFNTSKAGRRQRFQCLSCGHWWQAGKAIKV